MPRIFLPDVSFETGSMVIKNEKAKYLSNILRCTAGDSIIIIDDKGSSFSAKIISTTKKEITVKLLNKQDIVVESSLNLTLYQSLLKGVKMDFVVQKATELGVNKIIPVVTERSQVRETRKLSRWRKIAEEASKQSGRNIIPVISEPFDFKTLFTNAFQISGEGILFWEEGEVRISDIIDNFDRPSKISIFTGPEGGLSEREVKTATGRGFIIASLGNRILRAETAAITAVSIVQYEFGDLGTSSETGHKK